MTDPKKYLNPRQEKFAQFVATGMPASHAYVEAGYINRRGNADDNACHLLKTPRVEARVAEIREMAAGLGEALLTIVEKRRFLAEVVRTPLGNVGPESWLCQEYYEKVRQKGPRNGGDATTGPEAGKLVTRRRVKMVDKIRAIALDSKLAGHFPKPGTGPEKAPDGPPAITLEEIEEIAKRVKIVSPLLMKMDQAAPPSPWR